MNTVKISVDLPSQDFLKRLRLWASLRGISVSALVREELERAMPSPNELSKMLQDDLQSEPKKLTHDQAEPKKERKPRQQFSNGSKERDARKEQTRRIGAFLEGLDPKYRPALYRHLVEVHGYPKKIENVIGWFNDAKNGKGGITAEWMEQVQAYAVARGYQP